MRVSLKPFQFGFALRRLLKWPLSFRGLAKSLQVAALLDFAYSRVWIQLHHLNVRHGQHLPAQLAVVVLVVNHAHDAALDDFARAQLARKVRCVEGCAQSFGTARFDNGAFLCMQTQTLVQLLALGQVVVAALTATLVAVSEAPWRSVVAGGNDTAVFGNDGSNARLHAVGATCGDLSQTKEVSVEGGAD